MKNQTKIDSVDAISKFMKDVGWLEDSLLHEAVLLHPGYVDHERQMWSYGSLPDAYLMFQSQFAEVGAVLLRLRKVSLFQVCPSRDLEFDIDLSDKGVTLYPHGKGGTNSCRIEAAELEYAILGAGSLGDEYKLISPGNDCLT